MRITRIHVKNFKSLVDFTLDLEKFTCLVGMNGAGKTTVLQFLDFLSQLVNGDLDGWFERREWKPRDLLSAASDRRTFEFTVQLHEESSNSAFFWTGTFNSTELRCTSEGISEFRGNVSAVDSVQLIDGKVSIFDSSDADTIEKKFTNHDSSVNAFVVKAKTRFPVNFKYQGSILSAIKDNVLPLKFQKVRYFFRNLHSLELLSPHLLRRRSRESTGSMGIGGEKLASFLKSLSPEQMKRIERQLKKAYPRLSEIKVKSLRAGWKQLDITEKYGKDELVTNARHVNDGFLRMLAIMAELQSPHEFLIFDEIENGVNPELVEFVLDALCEARQQVLVTTHSPLILNYLDDEVAEKGVMYLYKTRQGATQAVPFFSIPSAKEKLTVMGPGEVYADTILSDLEEEIRSIPAAGE